MTFNASLQTVYVDIVGYTAFPGAETYRAYWYVAPWVSRVRFLISSHYSIWYERDSETGYVAMAATGEVVSNFSSSGVST
jgi:hypothetical protein